MKRCLKSVITVILTLSFLFSALYIPAAAQFPGESDEVLETVVLGDDAYVNCNTIIESMIKADEEHLHILRISEPGEYSVASHGPAIMMRSNVVLDLNGSTLVRTGDMENLFENEDFKGNRDNGGYDQTYNFSIKNGTLDGGESTAETSVINFGHASYITLENVNFKNCNNSHLVRFSGCSNVTVKNCTFTGFAGEGENGNYDVKEALQFDVCHESDVAWNSLYAADNTACKDVTVENCTFTDYPSGVGNHRAAVGSHNSNISIINNTFVNSLPEAGCAIWCYAFEDSLVSGNVISGNYNTAIRVSAGSVTVSGNTVSGVPYIPLYVTDALSSAGDNTADTVVENAASCVIKDNQFKTTGEFNAVTVSGGSEVSEISGNTFGSDKKSAIYCYGEGTSITAIKDNVITDAGEYGISVSEKARVDAISSNSITAENEAIHIASGAVVGSISGNKENVSSQSGLIAVSDTVQLGDDATGNLYTLENAIKLADETHLLTLKIAESGVYSISSPGRAIMMRSNIILDLNGSTLVRSGDMNNLFQNEDFEGNRDNGGYDQSYNITIKNGTLDGNTPENWASLGTEKEVNLVNFGHARNITFEDVNFKDCLNSHLVELSGCSDVNVRRCTFTGFKGSGKEGNYSVKEALQFDICHESDITWNGVYKLDDTVCKDITVENCTFMDYPSGVGNHHTVVGKHNSNISILNNTFVNTLPEAGFAIWCYAFENSLVSGNTISGNYNTAIRVSAGSVTVSDNTVSGVPYIPLYITKASSSAGKYTASTVEETAESCVIKDNTFITSGEPDGADNTDDKETEFSGAVNIVSGSKITELSGNTVGSEKKSAVFCSGEGTVIETVKDNTVTNAGEYGIAVANGAQIGTVSNNSIVGELVGVRATSGAIIGDIIKNTAITSVGKAENPVTNTDAESTALTKAGIWVSDSKVTKIDSNPITAAGGYAIAATGSNAQIDTISNNSVQAKDAAIRATSGAFVKSITSNTEISSSDDAAIWVSDSKVTSITSNPVITAGGYGIAATGSNAQIDTISNNSVQAKDAAIRVTSGALVKSINSNTDITSSSGEGILVSGSTVTSITSNPVTSTVKAGIAAANNAQIDTVSSNSLQAQDAAIRVTSGALIKNITGNTKIVSSGDAVIWVSDAKVTNITSNPIESNTKYGIAATGKTAQIGTVSKNSIGGKEIAVRVTSGAQINSINANTKISSASDAAIWVSDSKVTSITSNPITSTGKYGVAATGKTAQIDTVNKNTINGKLAGVRATSGALIKNIKDNTKITSSADAGIWVSDAKVTSITSNTVTSTATYGIAATGKTAQIDTVNKNTISGKLAGVRVTSGALIKNIKENTKITSSAGEAIWVSDSKVTNITSNTVTSSATYGIGVTGKTAQIDTVNKNTVTGKKAGVRVTSGALIKNIKENTKITSSAGEAIWVSDSKVTNITSNTVTSSATYGIGVAGKTAQIDTVNKNTVTGKKAGVRVTSGALIKNIKENTKITSSAGEAIWVSDSKVTNITSNTVTSSASYGIAAASKAQIDTISANLVTAKKAAVRVTSGAVVKNISGNTKITSSSEDGIMISGASVTKIYKNTVKNCGVNGILVSNTGKVNTVESNTVSGNKGYGVRVNNKKTTVFIGLNKYSKNKSGKEKISATVKKIYSVTYKLNGGTNSSKNPESYTVATATVTLKNPTRKGYTFKGWYSDSKFKTKVTKIPKGSKGNKTLYAKWKK